MGNNRTDTQTYSDKVLGGKTNPVVRAYFRAGEHLNQILRKDNIVIEDQIEMKVSNLRALLPSNAIWRKKKLLKKGHFTLYTLNSK